MTTKIRFAYTGFTPMVAQRLLNNATRKGYQKLGDHFFDTNLPRRFTYAGGKSLGYKARTDSYNRRKKKKYGHVDPMVFSGVSRDRVLSAMTKINAIATKNRSHVSLTLNAPALNFRRSSNSPNLRAEITRVSTREIPPLERVLQRDLETEFSNLK